MMARQTPAVPTKTWLLFRPTWTLEGNQSQIGCPPKSHQAIAHLQLVIDIREVEIHGALRYDELLGDLAAAKPLRDEHKHLSFPAR